MTIALTGSTGQLGRLVIHALQSRAPSQSLVALARTPSKAADLGVAVRQADYDRPETLAVALAGVDTLLLISANELGKRTEQHRHVIDAAKQAGVSRIVYTSLLHADTSSLSLAGEHQATEAMLKDSGIAMHDFAQWLVRRKLCGNDCGIAVAGGALIGSAGAGRISFAARADYAEAAAAVLSSAGHDGKVYELAGDESYTLADVAAEISRQTGRTIPYRNLPEADYAAALQGFGLPADFAKAIAGWDVCASQGALFHTGRELSRLIGRPTTALSAIVAAALK
ncbi:NAD(P)H-binding protein [Castellaniella sp.]|uniref:NAD(P)H-binding protein n=1 Tax=Castellaniella sp. TaxID=1955812 RepID=UPI002AFF2ABB|nr:NAD(P)H-binding protein [Castellaniella sp.]